jgi:hypothetical protein
MKLVLTNKDIERVLLLIFCDGGLLELYSSGIDYVYNKPNFEKFKQEGQSYEDNLLNLLKGGGRLKFVDVEGGEEPIFLTLQSATDRLSSVEDVSIIEDIRKLLDEDNVEYDAWTCYNVLQFILYGEVIFG